jgi:adenine-specific DNA-methyltransferase
MEKLRMESLDKVTENVRKIAALFPNCVTERRTFVRGGQYSEKSKTELVIDFDKLKQELSDYIVEGAEERYQFTWPDKKKAILTANSKINKTLRPCREESVNFDTTENLYIEGDNLEVLKLLQETYLGKVKMIYIDPPYNTGSDFVYRDNFTIDKDEYMENSGQSDEDGNRMVQNLESNGRYHTDWLNMMYPRLKLARDLLADDGVIFISMDENERANLEKICQEIFGKYNYIGTIIRKTKTMTADNSNGFNEQGESLFIFSKQKKTAFLHGEEKTFANYANPDNDPNGMWCAGDPSARSGGETTNFPIKNPYTNKIDYPPNGRFWAFSEETLKKYIKSGKIKFKQNHNENERGFIFKRYKKDNTNPYEPLHSLFAVENEYMNAIATNEIKDNMEFNVFSYPKPVKFLYKLIQSNTVANDIILDFFSGSATTAQAVMQLNAEDGGHRKFIMVQLPEPTDEKSEAYKAGYKNICEIGKERIRRAGDKIKSEHPEAKDLDIGFRVLKCDSSNMKDVYYTPAETINMNMFDLVDNVKEDRTAEDLLFQCMLEFDAPLSSSIETMIIGDKTVYNVAGGHLMACFDTDVTEEVITEVAKLEPSYFVMRDSSLANDSVAANFEQIFKTYSPSTERRVL